MNWLKLKLRDWVNSAQDVPSNLVGRGEKIALNSTRGQFVATQTPLMVTQV